MIVVCPKCHKLIQYQGQRWHSGTLGTGVHELLEKYVFEFFGKTSEQMRDTEDVLFFWCADCYSEVTNG